MIGIGFLNLNFIDQLQNLVFLPAPEFGFMAFSIQIDGIAFLAVFAFGIAEDEAGSSGVFLEAQIGFVDKVFSFHL